MPIKLVVSDLVAFNVKFSLNVEGKDHDFGFKCEARRDSMDNIQEALHADSRSLPNEPMPAWLRRRYGLRMVAWIGDPPLKDAETDAVIAPGDIALDALPQLVSNISNMLYAGYTTAVSAKGKLGN